MTKSSVSNLITFLLPIALVFPAAASNLPRSKMATLVESVSPTEVAVRATGIGYWDKGQGKKKDLNNFLLEEALFDARKAAVWFVLFGGTDPLLGKETERGAFVRIEEEFFDAGNVQRFIAWEGSDLISRIKREIKKNAEYELTIEKAFKINKSAIQDWLNAKGILPAREEIAEALGNPFLMVIPAVRKGESPIEVLASNPNLSHAAKVIEGYLTQRQYDVVVPEQQAALQELAAAQGMIKGLSEDPSYALALSIGSDVYITYEVSLENTAHNTRKASVNVRAYETTTARLLGTETGYSPSANVGDKVLIENAVNDAIDKVLARITAYWKDDVKSGVQYKVVVSIEGAFSTDQTEAIQMTFLDLWDEVSKNRRYKENTVSAGTLDYLVWCDPERYRQPTRLYQKVRQAFEASLPGGKLSQVSVNRKLLLLKIERG
ncbi:MAG: hypothetical protein FJY67_04890 [Calditrichaeota bacterium]|nr:hypothetical protein [Calditrichota bacterium]